MITKSAYFKLKVAFLIAGSAALLLSCKGDGNGGKVNTETLVTMRSENLSMRVSKNGQRSYFFTASLVETYGLAREPYTKYPQGVFVETFRDSTDVVESTLRADEAISYDDRDLWMASGNVVATGSGNTFYSEQLFWDARTDRIYSNVHCRVEDEDGVHFGTGLVSDAALENWEFLDYEGSIAVDLSPNEDGAYDMAPEDENAAEETEIEIVRSQGTSMQNGKSVLVRPVQPAGQKGLVAPEKPEDDAASVEAEEKES